MLLLASNGFPLGHVTGEFNDRFIKQADCEKFIAGKKTQPGTTIVLTRNGKDEHATIIGHVIACIEDTDGRAA